MPNGYVYILKCADDSYYTGSTTDLERRMKQHEQGWGANHTKVRLPATLVYYESIVELMWPMSVRNKSKVGGERRKKHLLMGNGNASQN